MTVRVLLSVMLFVAGRAAFGQFRNSEEAVSPMAPPPQPVVTFGSLALTAAGDTCKAVGFSADGRSVTVYGSTKWQRWEIATGLGEPRAGSVGPNEALYPCPDGQAVLCLGRTEERSGRVRVIDLKTGLELRSKAVSPTAMHVPSDDGTGVAVVGTRGTLVTWLEGKTPDVTLDGVTDVRRFAKAAAADAFALLGDDRVVVHTAAGLWKLDPPAAAAYTSVALTADGATLAVASAIETDDGRRPGPIDLWDVKTRRKIRTVEAVEWFAEAPHRLRFTPDGQTLVGGDGAYLRGWSTATGAKTFAVEPGWGWVGNVQISPDGKHVAVAAPGRPMVYELATGRQPAALLGHAAAVWDVAFSPDGTRAATAMFGRPTVYLWDAASGRNLGELQTPFHRPKDGGRVVPGRVRVQFSPDGSKLLTTNEASGGGTPVRVWDAKTLGLLRELPAAEVDAATVAFTPRGLFAVLDRKPTLVDADTGKVVWEKPPVPRAAKAVVSAPGDRVAVEGRTETTVWAVADGGEIDRVPGEPLGFTSDGAGLIFEGPNRSARVRVLAGGTDRQVVKPEREGATHVGPAGLMGVMAYPTASPPELRVRRAADGQFLSTCVVGPGAVAPNEPATVVFAADGRTVAVSVGRGSVAVFETYSGQHLFDIPDAHDLRALAFDPAGRTLLYARGTEDRHSQVIGHDATGGAWGRLPVAGEADVPRLLREVGDKPATARKAVYHLATRPADAVAFAREVTQLPTAADAANYARWLTELDAPAFALREAATKGLAKGGWRAEAVMRQTLAATDSVEVRTRLEKLLVRRDMRPLRAVHLLEVVGTPEAVSVLKTIATGPADSLVVQDAKWSLLRLESRPASRAP